MEHENVGPVSERRGQGEEMKKKGDKDGNGAQDTQTEREKGQ